MRNSLLVAIVVLIAGCNSDNNAKQNLSAGYRALEERQFDEAMARADQHLAESPGRSGSAEALYLKGRALEQKQPAGLGRHPPARPMARIWPPQRESGR